MSKLDAYNKKKKDEEEKVVGQQQKTQSDSHKPTGSTSIPKDTSRTQKSAASSLRTEGVTTQAKPTRVNTSQSRRVNAAPSRPERINTSQSTSRRESVSSLSDRGYPSSSDRNNRGLSLNTIGRRNLMDDVRSLPKANNVPDEIIQQIADKNGMTFEEAKKRISEGEKNQAFRAPGTINEGLTSKAQADYANQRRIANQKQQGTWESFMNNYGKAIADVVNGPVYLAGKLTGNDWDLVGDRAREAVSNAREQHPVASNIGTLAGMATAAYGAGGGAGGRAIGGANNVSAGQVFKDTFNDASAEGAAKAQAILAGLGNAARQVGVNAAKEMPIDAVADIIPTLANDIAEGKSAKQVAANTLLNTGLNFGFNTIGDIASMVKPGLEAVRPNNVIPSLDNVGNDVVEQAVRGEVEEAAEEAAERAAKNNIPTVSEQTAEEAQNILRQAPQEAPQGRITQSVRQTLHRDINKLENVTKQNPDFNNDAYVDLINAVDDRNPEAILRATKQFDDAAKASNLTGHEEFLDDINRYATLNSNISDDAFNSTLDVVRDIDTGLDRIARLDPSALSEKQAQKLSEDIANAKAMLKDYENTAFAGESVENIGRDINNALGRIHTQAAKLEGYDNVFENGFKKYDTVRGRLYGNSDYFPKEPKSNLSLEDQELMLDEMRQADAVNDQYRYARPANQSELTENLFDNVNSLPGADDLPKNTVGNTEAPELKVSQTYTNTGKNGGGWNDVEYNKYTDPKDYLYETKSEVDSVNEATQMRRTEGRDNFKERVLQKERMSSVEVDGLMMEWREITEEARQIEANGGDASALWNESNRVFKKIREQSTNNAQALQALAKWSRNTPEGMLIEAENIVNGKVKVEKGELQKQLEKYLKKNHPDIEFSGEFEQQFLNLASLFKQYDPNSMQAKQIMSQMGQLVNTQVPNKLSEKVTAWLMDSMLGNFRTLITRNAGGNLGLAATEQVATRPLAASIDSLVALKTGKRTQAGMSKAAISEYLGGMKKGLADELSDMKTGLHTARTGENTLSNAISSNRHVFKNKILDKFDSLVKNGLSVGDRPFYEATYAQTLGDYYRLRGDMGPDIAKLTDDEFKEYAETAAHLNALAAVYQNDSAISKGMLDLKNSIGKISEGTLGVDVLSQFSMPFVKTPANVIDRAIDYSPVGLLRNAIRTTKEGGIGGANFDQNRFVNESARNLIGTGITLGGGVAAANGLMSGKYSEDKDEKKAQQDAGMQEYALNLPGNYQMDIGWVPILGSNMVAGAAGYNAMGNNEGSTLDNLYSGVAAGGNELFGQAAMQGAQRLFGGSNSYNSNEGIMENAKNTVMGGFSQAIPSLLRQSAQVSDPYKRDVGNSNGGNYELNSIFNSIPGLRQNMLAPKMDSSGNPVLESQGRSIPSKILEDMILPGRISEVNYSPLDEEAIRLSEATGNKYSYMPKVNKKDLENDDMKLSNKEWEDYQVRYGQEMTNAGTAMMQTPEYSNMNDLEKENAMSDIYSAVRTAINSEYKGTDLKGASKAYVEGGMDAALDYVIYGNMVKDLGLQNNEKNRALAKEEGAEGLQRLIEEKANIDADGNGSYKQDEILNYINDGHQDEADRIWSEYFNGKATISQNADGNYEINSAKSVGKKNNNAKSSEKNTKSTENSTLAARNKAKQGIKEQAQQKESKIPEVQDNAQWSVESSGRTYDLHNTKTYERAQAAGISDNDFLNAFHSADTDGNGKIKKAEAKAYLDALDTLSRDEKRTWFDVLVTRQSKNPY